VTAEPLFEVDTDPSAPDLQAFAAARSVMPTVAPPWGSAGESAHLAAECDPGGCAACARAADLRGGS
jgi:hypothetical protein